MDLFVCVDEGLFCMLGEVGILCGEFFLFVFVFVLKFSYELILVFCVFVLVEYLFWVNGDWW